MIPKLTRDTRGRVQYVDVILAFATLVSFTAVAPWVYGAIDMGASNLPPLSSTLLQLILPVMVIGMLVSLGISARTN